MSSFIKLCLLLTGITALSFSLSAQTQNVDFNMTPSPACAGSQVYFNDISTPQSGIISRSWYFEGGSPNTSSAQNQFVTFATPGVKLCTLSVTYAGTVPIVITKTKYLTVGDSLTAQFSQQQTAARTFMFDPLSTNITQWNWQFGDGQSSTQENPTHTYTNEGTYTVVLSVFGPCGSTTAISQVTAVNAPTATFSISPSGGTGCAPYTANFSAAATPQFNTYQWTFPGGTPASSTVRNPQVTWNTPGAYEVKLKVTNINGVDSTTMTVNVTGAPPTTFNHSANGNTVAFTNTTAGATQWTWHFGDGAFSNQENPVHTYALEGLYTVTLTTAGPCGSSTDSVHVTVLTAPNASFSTNSTSNNTGCAPLTISFYSQANPAFNTFYWTFEGGTPATSTLPNPQVTWNTPGTYEAKLEVTNALGVDESSVFVTVNGAPQVGITYSYITTTLTYTFIPNIYGNGTVTWDLGDGTTSTENSPVHIYSPGTYTVVATISGPCGTSTSSGTIVVVGPPDASFSTSSTNNNTGCAPLAISFFSAADPAMHTFEWTFEGGTPATSNLPNPQVVWNDPGIFEAKLKLTNASGTDISSVQVTVNQGPALSYYYSIAGSTIAFGSNTINATGVMWDFGDGTTSTEQNPVHIYATPGTYTVTLTAFGPCGPTVGTFEVMAGSSAVNDLETVPVKVFPNPTADGVSLTLPENMVQSGAQLYLHGADGQLKQTLNTTPGDNNIRLEMNTLPSGYYILTVQTAEQKGKVKVVKI